MRVGGDCAVELSPAHKRHSRAQEHCCSICCQRYSVLATTVLVHLRHCDMHLYIVSTDARHTNMRLLAFLGLSTTASQPTQGITMTLPVREGRPS